MNVHLKHVLIFILDQKTRQSVQMHGVRQCKLLSLRDAKQNTNTRLSRTLHTIEYRTEQTLVPRQLPCFEKHIEVEVQTC